MKKILLLCLGAIAALAANSEIPKGYYSSLNGKSDADLKAAVRAVIYPHTEVSSYSDLPTYFRVTDVYPDYTDSKGNLRWWEMYSNMVLTTPPAPQKWSFSGLNREHTFPKSWWGGLTDIPAYTDLNILYPSEAAANSAKSNYPLGEVTGTPSFDNDVSKVGYAATGQGGGAAKVFEPADEYKGDFARAYFYTVTCYSNLTWTSKYMYMLQQNDYPTLQPWAVTLLLKWHREDPVSQKEIDRNDAVYSFQNNRNPFVDFPDLAEYIWGNKMGTVFNEADQGGTGGDPNLITPVQDMSLDFGEVAVGNKTTAKLFFNGENCTGTFTITIAGTDKAYFTPDTKSISATVVNSSSGYWLTVTYAPTAVGEHSARLIISDGGLTGSRGISLIGQCLEVPTLTALTALPATDITDDSYTANWEMPADGIADYFIVTRTRYVGGTATAEELVAETNSLIIDDFKASDSESYSVQTVRLGYRSPASNVIFVEHDGIEGVAVDQPLGVNCWPGIVRITVGEPQTNARIFDTQGRLFRLIPVIENEMELNLPAGVYLITTDAHRTPVRIVAR